MSTAPETADTFNVVPATVIERRRRDREQLRRFRSMIVGGSHPREAIESTPVAVLGGRR